MLHWYVYGFCLLYGNGLAFPVPPISVTGSGPHLWYPKIEYGKNCACKRVGYLEDAVGVGKVSLISPSILNSSFENRTNYF